MKSDQPHLRSGFTLIELLTVCGIISLLLGLSLPAIQGARERARRIQCANNLRQIGVASQSFHSSFQHFPPSPNTWPAKRVIVAAKILPLSAHYYLLPGLDHSALYNQIEFNGEHWTDADPPTSRNNQSCVETFIPVFACPSDNVPAGGTSYLISQGTSTRKHV